MIRCDDAQTRLAFCDRDRLRYEGLVLDLLPATEFDAIGERYWVRDGVLQDRGEQASQALPPDEYYVDSPSAPSLLACVHRIGARVKLRLEGELTDRNEPDLRAWVRELSPVGLATTHQGIRHCLSEELDQTRWYEAGVHTVTPATFRAKIAYPVRRLSPDDRPLWRRFVERNLDDPMVSGNNGCGSVVTNFEFICMGLPLSYYAAERDGELLGVTSTAPGRDRYDGIGTLFVAPEFRRQGVGASLLSVATRDLLAKGRQPDYFAGGDEDALPPLLSSLGYQIGYTFSWTERYMWYDWVVAQEP